MDDKDTVRVDPGSIDYSPSEKVGLLQIIRGEDIGREFEIKPGNNIIGRQKDSHIQIVNKSISRRHAQVVFQPDKPPGERYVLYDLQSTNGTRVNNSPVERSVLYDGDRVHLGRVVCKFLEVDALEKNYMAELKKLIEYDKQTNLLQIKPFYERLEKALVESERSQQHLSVFMMDLDGLKQINDKHGHLVGTNVIIKLARLINQEFSAPGIAAVYGGDEFAAYLPNTDKTDALVKAERLRGLVSALSFEEEGIQDRVTLSIGVAEYPTDAMDTMTLVGNADKALYAAKATGKNCVAGYEGSMLEGNRQ